MFSTGIVVVVLLYPLPTHTEARRDLPQKKKKKKARRDGVTGNSSDYRLAELADVPVEELFLQNIQVLQCDVLMQYKKRSYIMKRRE